MYDVAADATLARAYRGDEIMAHPMPVPETALWRM